jgi:putative hydrolase of the HAD superfamily
VGFGAARDRPGYEAAGYEPARALELADAARRLYVDPKIGWELFGDTLPALERLSQAGWTHAILSNHVPELRQIVAALGLDDVVSFLSCSAETGYEKPHAQAFASVLDPLRPSEAWMIGDNVVADVLGAQAGGIPAVLVRRPDPRATRYADSLAGVEAFLSEAVAA